MAENINKKFENEMLKPLVSVAKKNILPRKSERRLIMQSGTLPSGEKTRKKALKKIKRETQMEERQMVTGGQEYSEQQQSQQNEELGTIPTFPFVQRKTQKSGGMRIAKRMAGAIGFIGMLLSGGGDSASAAVMEVTKFLS
ncbi:MAG: hypothetical protein WC269_05145 [Candidatus Gracilibacteria bacterium]|jgi:hypothetical protein